VHLAIIKVFYYQMMHKRIVLKTSIKIYVKIAPTCFGVITIISEHTLPDVGDRTETCCSYFNVNFNTPFQNNSLVHHLVIKNFDTCFIVDKVTKLQSNQQQVKSILASIYRHVILR